MRDYNSKHQQKRITNLNALALHYVAQRARGYALRQVTVLAMIEALLKAGTNMNAKDKEDKTPLHWAVSMGASPAVVRTLAKAGAQPSEKTLKLIKDPAISRALEDGLADHTTN